MVQSTEALFVILRSLVEAWCDRRCFNALRRVLAAYPMPPNALTDNWAELAIALEEARAFARAEITESELQTINEAIPLIWKVVRREQIG